MVGPQLEAGIEQRNERARDWIPGRRLGIFVIVAALAGKGEILQLFGTSGFVGDNMIYREGVCREASLTAAVLTGVSGALRHDPAARVSRLRHSTGFECPTRSSGSSARSSAGGQARRGT